MLYAEEENTENCWRLIMRLDVVRLRGENREITQVMFTNCILSHLKIYSRVKWHVVIKKLHFAIIKLMV